MKSRIVSTLLAVLLAGAARAELRTWTGTTGSQLQAELVKEADGKVVLRDETGRELKVPRSYLSKADIAYLDSHAVPVISIKPNVQVHSEYQIGHGVVQMVKYDIEIRKINSDPYAQPFEVVLYLVGNIGENNYVVLQRTVKQVRFTEANRNPHVSGPDLSLGSPELQKKYEVKYVGHLVVARTRAGRIIEVASDNPMLESNAGYLVKFGAGDIFGKDMKPID